MKLYHYYEKDNGPFRSISDFPDFKYGPECYIEVQIWTDRGLEKWLKDEERL